MSEGALLPLRPRVETLPPRGVPPERLLEPWTEAHERALRYAQAAGRPDAEALARRAVENAALEASWPTGAGAIERSVAMLRSELGEPARTESAGRGAGDALLRGLRRAWLGREPAAGDFTPAPPIARRSMASRDLHPSESAQARRARVGWVSAARRRRVALVVLVVAPALLGSFVLSSALPSAGAGWVDLALMALFGALFGWISFGFWTALAGALLLLRGGDRFAVKRRTEVPGPLASRTALLMPICEEPVARVFAGLRATHRSLERAGVLEHFDFFVLSDSADPDVCAREQLAWAAACRDLGGFGRIFYRRRKIRINKKSGNIADFCRRWGNRYEYFVVLDADSVMSGETLRTLVARMQASPDAAVMQTVPAPVGRSSLFGRVTQFASRLQGPLFATGLHFWQLGDVPYWGHNAIVRTRPFMEFAALPRLRGRPPLGGPILSHDFVEAALLGRAGYSLWLAFDLPGSFEETPATLLEEMRRDRRWCQGNLQHLRLLFEDGFFTAHRALFLNGAFAYASALLWLAFLLIGTANALVLAVRGPTYFPETPVLYPDWPVWHPARAAGLVVATATLLFVPKLVALAVVALRSGAQRWGGAFRLFGSVVGEALFSALLAPIRMMFHVRFVISALAGSSTGWVGRDRADVATRWSGAVAQHGIDTLIAGAWALTVLWLDPSYFPWLAPVLVALALSIPTSVLSSRAAPALRRARLFATPEEIDPPKELTDLAQELAAAPPPTGFAHAIVDPGANAALRAMAGRAGAPRASDREAVARALAEGPQALTPTERRRMLGDEQLLGELHQSVWLLPPERAAAWGIGGA